MARLNIADWGMIEYSDGYERQKQLFESVIHQKVNALEVDNTLIYCEHHPVITMGKNGHSSNLLFPQEILQERRISFYRIDRGGDITYHGPGQLVVYPVLDLETFGLGLKTYIHLLEEVVIRLLKWYRIPARRMEGITGVWIKSDGEQPDRKICAIGVRSSRYVTMHGLALNVNTDLAYFNLINPCGFKDKGVTSMEKELSEPVDMNAVKEKFTEIFKAYLF